MHPFLLSFLQVYCSLVIITGVLGNICVLIVFIAKWNRLRTYELFFVSLAIADIIGTMVYPLYKILELRETRFQDAGCKTVFYLNHVSITVSSLTLTAVSIDRYIAVRWIHWSLGIRKVLCKVMLALSWLIGGGFCLVYLFGKAMESYRGNCRMNKTQVVEIVWTTYVSYSLQNFIPIVVMIFLYSLIIYELYKTSESCKQYLTSAEFMKRRSKNRKTTKLLIVVVVVFFVCVTPKSLFYMFYINRMFGMSSDIPSSKLVIIDATFTILKMSNSCANPIIYSRLHASFRKRIKLFIENNFSISELVRGVSKFGTSSKLKSQKSVETSHRRYEKSNGTFSRRTTNLSRKTTRRNGEASPDVRRRMKRKESTLCKRISLEIAGARYSLLPFLKESHL